MSPHPLRRLALAASLFATVLPAAHASTATPPPAFADPVYVLNGCHISTLNFVARFQREFPHERAELARVLVRSVDDLRVRHTIALFTWQGAWWCRDDIVGLAALDETVQPNADLAALGSKAEAVLDRVEARKLRQRQTRSSQPEIGAELSSARRTREVRAAAELLPLPGTIYWVRTGSREIPVLLFHPAPGQIAVYEPTVGSCLAETKELDDAKVVKLVGEKLGLAVKRVRAEAPALKPVHAARLAAR